MELLTMTKAELERLRILQEVQRGFRRQRDAAMELGVSERQLRRLLRGLEAQGAASVPSKKRGKAPNNRVSDTVRAQVLERCRSDYRGFGPTFLAETLAARDGIEVSAEWLRALLIEHDLWRSKRRKRNVHPLRERRPRFGELVQMDGSPHDWFEERGPRCTLLLAIDDATSRITSARFENAETTDGYLLLIRKHLETFGRFRAAYTDKHSIFRYSGSSTNNDISTQLQRALDELEIELICANSPQAKGRVERANCYR
jgi:transposase